MVDAENIDSKRKYSGLIKWSGRTSRTEQNCSAPFRAEGSLGLHWEKKAAPRYTVKCVGPSGPQETQAWSLGFMIPISQICGEV